MLQIRDLRVVKADKTICHVARLDVQPGERVAVLGPNGSGKSTLLRVLGGLEAGFQGQCRVAAAPRERVYVHQSPYLFRGSVLSNVTYGLEVRGVGRRQRLTTAQQWLGVLGVAHLVRRSTRGLSGGERRRIALARALALQPELLLLDEPLADLDQDGIDTVCRVLQTVSRSTVLIASPVPLPAIPSLRSCHLQDS